MAFLLRLGRLPKHRSTLFSLDHSLINHGSFRNYAKNKMTTNWVRPPIVPSYDASQSGDLTPFELPKEGMRRFFDLSENLKNTKDENVKKIFSISNQSIHQHYYNYKLELMSRVRAHQFDKSSTEVRIAKATARIRIFQHIIKTQTRTRKYRSPLNISIISRNRRLNELRKKDYKKFEWVLEKLDLKYYPRPLKSGTPTRKEGTKLLAEYTAQKMKELRLGELKKKLDQEKVPFMEKKLEMLKMIKEKESAYQLEQTVTDADIENCMKQLEQVKIQVENNKKRGYVRKVHPYTLEQYFPENEKGTET